MSVFCPFCGTDNAAETDTCTACGSPLAKKAASTRTAHASRPAPLEHHPTQVLAPASPPIEIRVQAPPHGVITVVVHSTRSEDHGAR